MRILITGANGFLGKNFRQSLVGRRDIKVNIFTRENSVEELFKLVENVDLIFHLAGINRPVDPKDFLDGNAALTDVLCAAITASGRMIPVIFTSSIHADSNNPYGISKRMAEDALFKMQRDFGIPVRILRLPNVFGKWCEPNYNSVVATFCHNLARNIPIHIVDSSKQLTLVYIDDVVKYFISVIDEGGCKTESESFVTIFPQYSLTVGDLSNQIQAFKDGRENLIIAEVGVGLARALYSTYVSYLPKEKFSYQIPQYVDARGKFVEMIKTVNSGQLSYFTVRPGVTRGGHYHHSKSEKFLVIRGLASFRFHQVITGETHKIIASGEEPQVVDTIPGWAHDVTNIGNDEMLVMLWSNEVFDSSNPDTYSYPLLGD